MREHIPEDRCVLRIDSMLGMADAVRHNTGVGLLLCILGDEQPELIRLNEPFDDLDTDLWILTHPALKRVARIKAFSDFLDKRLRASDKLAPAAL